MARNTMTWLITFLRMKVNDTSESIWTDDELEDYLDMYRVQVHREFLIKCVDQKVYISRFGMFEDDVILWNSNSANAVEIPSNNYTANLVDGIFTFAECQDGDYYLDGKSYSVHSAIAECMEQLAMDPNKAREWGRGSVKYTHYDLIEMSKYHRSLGGAKGALVVKRYRK